MTKKQRLKELQIELERLTNSPLYGYRKKNNYKPVLGNGSLKAGIMFVGEAPGRNEAEAGKPFCGVSGKRLDSILKTALLPREEVYITNIVNDRPPKNRKPTKAEIALYAPFLLNQMQIIKPRVIVTLGATSVNFFLEKFNLKTLKVMSKLRENFFELSFSFGKVFLVPTFHPSYLTYRPEKKVVLLQDIKKAKSLLKKN